MLYLKNSRPKSATRLVLGGFMIAYEYTQKCTAYILNQRVLGSVIRFQIFREREREREREILK